jgi:hypothetical protein
VRRKLKFAAILPLIFGFCLIGPLREAGTGVVAHASLLADILKELADYGRDECITQEVKDEAGEDASLVVALLLSGISKQTVWTALTSPTTAQAPSEDWQAKISQLEKQAEACQEVMGIAKAKFTERATLLRKEKETIIGNAKRLMGDADRLSSERSRWSNDFGKKRILQSKLEFHIADLQIQLEKWRVECDELNRSLEERQAKVAKEEESLAALKAAYEQHPITLQYRNCIASWEGMLNGFHEPYRTDFLRYLREFGEAPPVQDLYPFITPPNQIIITPTGPRSQTVDDVKQVWRYERAELSRAHQEFLKLSAPIRDEEVRVKRRATEMLKVAYQIKSDLQTRNAWMRENSKRIQDLTTGLRDTENQLRQLETVGKNLAKRGDELDKSNQETRISAQKWKSDMRWLYRFKKDIIDVCLRNLKYNSVEREKTIKVHESSRRRDSQPGHDPGRPPRVEIRSPYEPLSTGSRQSITQPGSPYSSD